MVYRKIDIADSNFHAFRDIGDKWMLVTAAKENGQVNTMTASWGSLGVLWKKNIATIYLRPQRYTREFVDDSEYFTLTFFDGHKDALALLGSKSGRDGDKIAESGLELIQVDGQPTFAEGNSVLVCRKLYRSLMAQEDILDREVIDTCYPEPDYHYVYIGEIVAVYQNESEK